MTGPGEPIEPFLRDEAGLPSMRSLLSAMGP